MEVSVPLRKPHLLLSLHNLIIGFCLRAISTNFDITLDDNLKALKLSMERLTGLKLPAIILIS